MAVNPDLPSSEHSTDVSALGRDTGQPRPIVVERLMRWNNQTEGHRSTGTSFPYGLREFAEGGGGFFTTYLALWNTSASAGTFRVYYRHENGSVYSQDVVIAALARVVLGTPSWVPAGGYGLEILSPSGHAFAAERMVYGGTGWSLGHVSPGATHGANAFRFAEGTSAGMFETYVLLTNIAGTAATVTLTYRTAAGAVIGSDALVIPAYGRGTVWANGTTGGQDFTTEVSSTQQILAERAMYWPSGASGLSSGASRVTSVPAGPPADAIAAADASPYTLTEGTPGPTIVGAEDAAAPTVVVGKPVPGSAVGNGLVESSSSGPSWYGSHLTLGKRP